jgi:hypothetical protein
MSDLSLVLIPLAVLAIVVLFGFVGCGFQVGSISDPTLVSLWNLGDATGPATDVYGTNPGTYTSAVLTADVPSQSPATANPAVLGLASAGILEAYPAEASLQVDGGYVEVPFSTSINTPEFSVLGWVHPDFDPAETQADGKHVYRSVITSRSRDGAANNGYSIYAGPKLLDPADPVVYWQAWIGTGVAGEQWTMLIGPPVDANQTTHLALTYGAGLAQFFVNGSNDTTGTPDASATTAYSPNASKSTYIGMGSTESTPPRYPFKGRLQYFRYNNAAIPFSTIDTLVMTGQLTP